MIGQFVASGAGHDKDRLYLIVAEEEDFVALCDGRIRPMERPKRKRRKHIRPIGRTVGEELVQDLMLRRATNEQIKYAIRQYQKENQN